MKNRLTDILRRGVSAFLALTMVFSLFPSCALAYETEKPDSLSIVTADGTEQLIDESWVQQYPYGVFAFENGETTVLKGRDSQTIKVYRLGGTKGRAHLNITYTPAYTQVSEHEMSYATAAGKNDILIEVEDALEYARYQPLAAEPEPAEPELPILLLVSDMNEDSEYTISLDGISADSYMWYLYDDGVWSFIRDATDDRLVIDAEHALDKGYDVMCVVTIDGIRYGSHSAAGAPYIKPEEDFGMEIHPADLADMIAAEHEQTFSILPMNEENEYAAYIFEMVFAEDEWVKEIRITGPDRGSNKENAFGILQMVGNEGGEIFRDASALVIQIHDEDYRRSETQVGFTVESTRVDKSAGQAVVTVARSGDTNYPVTCTWKTQEISVPADGPSAAVAGLDYTAADGQLMLYADIRSAEIRIPLIDDGLASEEDRRFAVVLENLLGGGEDESAVFSADTVYVDLYNSATATAKNLSSVLYDATLVDVSDRVTTESHALVAEQQLVTGTLQEAEPAVAPIPAKIVLPGQGAGGGIIAPMSFTFGAKLDFSDYRNMGMHVYNPGWWNEILVQTDCAESTLPTSETHSAVGRYTWQTFYGEALGVHTAEGELHLGILSNKSANSYLVIPEIGKRFSYISYESYFQHRMNYDYNGKNYILEPHISVGGTNPPIRHRLWSSLTEKTIPIGDEPKAEMDDYRYSARFYRSYSGYFNFYTNDPIIDLFLSIRPMLNYKAPKGEHYTEHNAFVGVKEMKLTRRAFGKDFGLRIHTANDANVAYVPGTDVSTLSLLDATKALYDPLKPTVSIVLGQGGINRKNKLFVGSLLNVTTDRSATYQMLKHENMQGVFLSQNVNGVERIVAVGTADANSPNSANLELIWGSLSEEDLLYGDFTVNIVMQRRQDVVIELQPSVPRKEDGITIDETQIAAAYDLLRASNDGHEVTITYSAIASQANTVATDNEMMTYRIETRPVPLDLDMTSPLEGSTTAFKLASVDDIQSINFNLNSEDLILYNGMAYRGNETIPIQKNAMNNSKMVFRYYHVDYINALNVMTPLISDIALYLDTNGNGRIDGYFDTERNMFIYDDSEDDLVGYLTLEAYEETLFAPVLVVGDDGQEQYVDHYISVEYTITPRCLVIPPTGSTADRAQILPALTTGANNANSLAKLSKEQKEYRYVASGPLTIKSGDRVVQEKAYSSDDLLMYEAAASSPHALNFPAGGDRSPARRSVPGDFTSMYVWTPRFHGNLLFPYVRPAPIAIEDSLAGKNIPIAALVESGGSFDYEADGVGKLNGFLGSLSGVDTFVVTVNQQQAAQNELTEAPLPEVTRFGNVRLFPNADHLLVTSSPENRPGDATMSSHGKGDYDEFNVDMGVELPNIEIGLSDYVTIVLDGYDIGFAIGIPLGGTEQKNVGGTAEKEGKNPRTANAENGEKFKQFFTGSWGQLIKDDAYNKARQEKNNPTGTDANGNPKIDPGKMKSSSKGVSFNLRIGFMFTYNPLDNGYYFSKFAVSIAAGFDYSYTYKLTPCPIVFVYVKVGVSLTLTTGLQVVREVVESENQVSLTAILAAMNEATDGPRFASNGDRITGTVSDRFQFTADNKAYNLYFEGKLLIEFYDQADQKWVSNGYVASTNMNKAVTVILKQQDGYKIKAGEEIVVRFIALEETMVDSIVPIVSADNYTYWSGMRLQPSIVIEAGAGLGVDMLKVELFLQLVLDASMNFGIFDLATKTYEPFEFESFEMKLGIGVRVVLLFFTIEKEAIQYIINYENGRSGGGEAPWMHGYSALGGAFGRMYPIGGSGSSARQAATLSRSLVEEAESSSALKMPQSTADTQRIKTFNDSIFQPFAFESFDAPFQLSGYSSSGDAFTLVDNLTTGYDYKVVTIGERNYLLYHISRQTADDLDASMLVLSEIMLTGENTNNYGLRNPADPSNLAQPYLVVDADSSSGDLDFSAWVNGNTLEIAWMSYADPAAALAAAFTKSATAGKTSIAASANAGHHLVYTIGTEEVTGVKTGDTVRDTSAFANGDYILNEGHVFTLYELDADDRVVAFVSHRIGEEEIGTLAAPAPITAEEALAAAAKNTVVKTASWTAGAGAFTPAEIVAQEKKTVFSPRISGDALVHVTAEPYTDEELDAAVAEYEAYLQTIYDTEADVAGGNISFLTDYYRGMKTVYGKKNSLTISSKNAQGTWFSDTRPLTADESANRTVDNIDFVEVDGMNYLAYTTAEEDYIDGELVYTKRLILRSVTIDPAGNGGSGEITFGTPYQLRTIVNYDNAALPNTENERNKDKKDGVYKGTELSQAYTDPYFAGLKFLNAKLGELTGDEEEFSVFTLDLDEGKETFLLFEMNGNTYVIPEKDIRKITDNGHGRIIPFFTMETYLNLTDDGKTETVEATASGYSGVTIGADNAGNLAAVYVGTVANTGNNAIYISHYYTYENQDQQTVAGWSPAQMLAMNNMQVHEDALSKGWSDEETRHAYLEGITASAATTKAYQVAFSNLQFAMIAPSEDTDAVPGILSEPSLLSSPLGENEMISSAFAADIGRSGASSEAMTLILTEAAVTGLVEETFTWRPIDADEQELTAVMPAGPSKVGFYAIAFGQGKQAIGNAKTHISSGGLYKGYSIEASLSFTNTGNTRIRASDTSPATVSLMLAEREASSDTVVAAWTIEESINPGQEVALSGMAALPRDVRVGDSFYFTVSEDETYIGLDYFHAHSYTTADHDDANYPLGRYVVRDLPDLGFEQVTLKSVGVTPEGKTILETDFYVTNRGTKDAEAVIAQFKLQTGTDDQGQPIWKPLDLTGSAFEIGNQKPLEDLIRLFSNDCSPQNGILKIESTEPNSDGSVLAVSYGRHVSGTFLVGPEDYLLNAENSAEELIIEMELFSGGDSVTATRAESGGFVYSVEEHDELTSINNSYRTLLNHKTYFATANNIALPLGTPLMLPIALKTTYEGRPDLIIREVRNNDSGGEMEDCLGALYYDETLQCIVLSPAREGTGIIRATDIRSNISYDIAFSVTQAGEGINIFNNNNMLRFYNSTALDADGTYSDPYDPQGTAQKWTFLTEVGDWNPDPNLAAPDRAVMPPYLYDLARGARDALFTFKTLATGLTLYFSGEIEVSSTYPRFQTQTFSSAGGNSEDNAVKIDFAKDAAALSTITHTVTIKVLSENAQFDRYKESFGGSATPTPSDDIMAPQLFWNRSFPQVASVRSSTERIPLRLTMIDDAGLASVEATRFAAEGMVLTKLSPSFWYLDWDVSQNGSYTFDVTDIAGNKTSRTVNVGWFAAAPSGEAEVPELTAGIEVDGEAWTLGALVSKEKRNVVALVYDIGDADDVTVTAERGSYIYNKNSDGTDTDEVIDFAFSSEGFALTNNGIYRITATDARGNYRSDYLFFNGIDSSIPVLTLRTEVDAAGKRVLYYEASKNAPGLFRVAESSSANTTVAPLAQLTINGASVALPSTDALSAKGNWIPQEGLFGGSYTLAAKDTAGNEGFATYEVEDIPLRLDESTVVVESDWTQSGGEGRISFKAADIQGGRYDPDLHTTKGIYTGKYEYALVAAEKAFTFQDVDAMTPEEQEAYETERDAYFRSLSFADVTANTELSLLAAGDYVLYLRDAFAPEKTALISTTAIRIRFEAITVELAVYATRTSDARIEATAAGGIGSLGTYQFALQEASPAVILPADDPSWIWRDSEDWDTSFDAATFDALRAGHYQIAIRAMPGISQEMLSAHDSLARNADAAEARFQDARSAVNTLMSAKRHYDAAELAYLAQPDDEDTESELNASLFKLSTLCRDALRREAKPPTELDAMYTAALSELERILQSEESQRDTQKQHAANSLDQIEKMVADAYTQNPELYRNALVKAVQIEQLYEVIFDPNGGVQTGGGDLSQIVAAGEAATAPLVSRDRYRFIGWDTEFGTVFSDLIVSAQWEYIPTPILPPNQNQATAGGAPADSEGTAPPDESTPDTGTGTDAHTDTKPPPSEDGNKPPSETTDDTVRTLIGEITVITPAGQEPQPLADGTWLLSDGATITTPGGVSIELPPGTQLSADGLSIRLPRGQEGAKVTYPESQTEAIEPGMWIDILDPNLLLNSLNVYWINPFADTIPDDWFYDDLSYVYRYGLLSGMTEEEFGPELTVSRAMLITVLHRLAGSPSMEGSDNPFRDVAADAWYREATTWAALLGITSGYGDGLFGSEDPISRQDLAALLCRFADTFGIELPKIREYTGFADEDAIADYAYSSLVRLVEAGIFGGKPDNLIDPRGETTRAELAALLHRFLLVILS